MEGAKTRDGATALAVAFTLLALIALAIGAFMLADSQERQREDARERFGQRAEIASSLLDALFRVAFLGTASEASERYGGRVRAEQLDARLENNRYLVVVDTT